MNSLGLRCRRAEGPLRSSGQQKQQATQESADLQPKVYFAAQPVQAKFAVRLVFS